VRWVVAFSILFILLGVFSSQASAAEIRVFCLPGMRGVLNDLGPKFESASGRKLVMTYEVNAPLMRRIDAGEKFDVAIITPAEIENLKSRDKVAADSRIDLARVGIAVWIRPGAERPDISSVDAFKQMLLKAKSISYTKESNTGIYVAGLIERLGLADLMRPKTKLLGGGGQNVRAVAAGEIEYGISILSDGIGQSGVELLALLPEKIQNWTIFSSAIAANADDPVAAKAFIAFLQSAEAGPVMKGNGLEVISRLDGSTSSPGQEQRSSPFQHQGAISQVPQ
jgi:molybdate transport system substrate-binding protein